MESLKKQYIALPLAALITVGGWVWSLASSKSELDQTKAEVRALREENGVILEKLQLVQIDVAVVKDWVQQEKRRRTRE